MFVFIRILIKKVQDNEILYFERIFVSLLCILQSKIIHLIGITGRNTIFFYTKVL